MFWPFVSVSLYDAIEYEWFLNIYIRLIDGTLTHTTTLGQSGLGSNNNEVGNLHF